MRADVAEEWVRELRSGRYKQGMGQLYNSLTQSYCCLGVLCDIASRHITIEKEPKESINGMSFDGSAGFLPYSVRKWAEMRFNDGAFRTSSLVLKNDHGKTFLEIADIIEANREEL